MMTITMSRTGNVKALTTLDPPHHLPTRFGPCRPAILEMESIMSISPGLGRKLTLRNY